MLAHEPAPISWEAAIGMLGLALMCHSYVVAVRRSRLPKPIRWRNGRWLLYLGDFVWTVTVFYLMAESTHETEVELRDLVAYTWIGLVTWPAARTAVWETYFR